MYCPNCGAEIAKEASVCPACGAVLEQEAPAAEPAPIQISENPAPIQDTESPAPEQAVEEPAPDQASESSAPAQAPEDPVPAQVPADPAPVQTPAGPAPVQITESPALTALKQTATSGAFMTAVISFTIVCLLSIASAYINRFSLNGLTDFAATVDGLLASTPFNPNFTGMVNEFISKIDVNIVNTISNSFMFSGIASVVPSLIIAIGMWTAFISVKNGKGSGVSGLVIVKTVRVVQFVFLCIVCAAAVAVGVLAVVFSSKVSAAVGGFLIELGIESDFSAIIAKVMKSIGTIYTLIAAMISAIVIVIESRILVTINSALKTAKTGELCKNISGFIAVLLFLSVPGTISNLFTQAITGNLIGAVSTAANITATIAFGVTIFLYKSKLKHIT